MTDFNFKVGDKIYYPKVSDEILTVQERSHNKYPLFVELGYKFSSFTTFGKHITDDSNPSVFPATQEWYDKLVQIYPNLEKPPARKDPKEIIQAMLDNGWGYVPCWVSNVNGNPNKNSRLEIILEIRDGDDYPLRADITAWRYAVPFDPRTGKDIIDYIDGRIVLEG